MKKALLLVVALAIGGAAFAQNKTKGLDIQLGFPLGVNSMTTSSEDNQGFKITNKWTDIAFFQLKFATYDLLWVQNHIGLYGSIGVNILHIASSSPVYFGGNGEKEDDYTWNGIASGEFMFGAAFGVDFGKNMRFQSGVALHYMISNFNTSGTIRLDNISTEARKSGTLHSLGLALTPQFRTTVNRRCSFIVGADMVFGAPIAMKATTNVSIYRIDDTGSKNYIEGSSTTSKEKITSAFTFKVTPYIGLGINF